LLKPAQASERPKSCVHVEWNAAGVARVMSQSRRGGGLQFIRTCAYSYLAWLAIPPRPKPRFMCKSLRVARPCQVAAAALAAGVLLRATTEEPMGDLQRFSEEQQASVVKRLP
jgi:hypothetical protein